MKVSLIVAVYKDVQALELIIKSLKYQTYRNFEVIIPEEGKSQQMQEYVKTIKDLEVIHRFRCKKKSLCLPNWS